MLTGPQTIGYSLADSPVGLAAWFYDKFADWTDSGSDLQRSLSYDEMLDDISLPCKGGHFAAWEEPEVFTFELRAAFRSLR